MVAAEDGTAVTAEEVAPAPVRVSLVVHYPSWFPRILDAINIRARGSKQFIDRLHIRLRAFTGAVAYETNSEDNVVAHEDKDGSDPEDNAASNEDRDGSESASDGSGNSQVGV